MAKKIVAIFHRYLQAENIVQEIRYFESQIIVLFLVHLKYTHQQSMYVVLL